MDAATTDARYEQLLHAVSKENFAHQPLYELSFVKPLTPKRKYYQAIISNEAIRFLNSVHNLIKDALNDNERKFHIHKILKNLPAKLHETEKIIASRNLYFSLIDDTTRDKKLRDDAFIIQCLKYQLICLYLEIQNKIYRLGGLKEITDLHIRKFLNHRYNTNIEREFTNFKKKERLDKYLEKNSGLPLIFRF
jgi:hypothetical protein